MMKRITALLSALFLVVLCAFPVSADDWHLQRLIDNAGLLSQTEFDTVLAQLDKVSERHQMDVAVVTVDGLPDGYYDIMVFSDDLFDYGYGMGDGRDGILLVIDMQERQWWMSTGGAGIETFTDYGLEQLENSFLSYLSSGDYAGAFTVFAETCDDFCRQAEEGTPVDIYYYDPYTDPYTDPYRYQPALFSSERILPALLIGFVISLIVVFSMKSKLRSVYTAAEASLYREKNRFVPDSSNDLFLYKSLNKTPKQDTSSSGRTGGGHSGGSSVHHSSSGVSHGGRGGRF